MKARKRTQLFLSLIGNCFDCRNPVDAFRMLDIHKRLKVISHVMTVVKI